MITLLDRDITREWYDAALASRIVGMDIETSGLSLEKDKIATIQMYVPNKGTVMVRHFPEDDIPEITLMLLESNTTTKIFHHAPFDLGFLVRDYGIFPRNIADTKVAAKILDPRRQKFIHPETNKGSHSLISLIWYYFDYKLNKGLATSDWFAPELSLEQLKYAAEDVEFLPELLRRLEYELSETNELHLARAAYQGIPAKVVLQVQKNVDDVYSY